MSETRHFIARSADGDPSLVTRHVAGETLIVPVSGNMADLESIFVLNDVGSHIWARLLRGPATVDELARAVVAAFDVSADAATADVAAFLDDLSSRRLVRVVEESGRP
ncbi:MAG TPA: PqqD family protein [Vicinamibacterales bacterium]|nr:PqqD family protein [Vicinamibacterales bacterium]